MEQKFDIVIVIPVYNDWDSFNMLLDKLNQLKNVPEHILVLAVNDGSANEYTVYENQNKIKIQVLHLTRNLGHQKAIAIGLSYAVDKLVFSHIIIMDSDGEDKPEDIERLWSAAHKNETGLIFAKRIKRTEGMLFRAGYYLYKILFKILTGTPISFGNFCLLSYESAKKVTYVSEIWNHFSAGIIRSKIPYTLMPTERGKRLKGKSQMNFQTLILHGLGSLSVHIDIVAVRLIASSMVLLFVSLLAIVGALGIRLFTNLAIPGWASTVVLGFSLIFLQSLFFSVLLVFIILSYRTQKNFIPALDYQTMIGKIELI